MSLRIGLPSPITDLLKLPDSLPCPQRVFTSRDLCLKVSVRKVQLPVCGFNVVDQTDHTVLEIRKRDVGVDPSNQHTVVLTDDSPWPCDAIERGSRTLHQRLAILGLQKPTEVTFILAVRPIVSVVNDVAAQRVSRTRGRPLLDLIDVRSERLIERKHTEQISNLRR